jgi:hypothetical protein
VVDYSDAGNIRDVIFSDPVFAKRLSHDISDTAARRLEPLRQKNLLLAQC